MKILTLTTVKTKVYKDKRGYYRFRDSNILLSRWVVSKKYGRWPRREEVTHHLNGLKSDNRPSNLIICEKEDHKKIHEFQRNYYGNWNKTEFKT